jgi:hypothetical protein
MMMHSVRQKAERAPTGPSDAAAPVRRAPTKQWQPARLAASRATAAPSISAQIPMPIIKIAAPPPQPPAAAQFTTAKSP